jgi:nucleotide-binding universal stress UspA family protein
MIESILVALDKSPRAPSVFEVATSLARKFGAEVFIARVLWVPPDLPPAAHVQPDGLEIKVEHEAREELHILMATAPDVNFGPPIVVEGDPARRILRIGDDLDVNLIVMGSHHYQGLDHVLGTTAAHVVNHARRDVFVVHAEHLRRDGS